MTHQAMASEPDLQAILRRSDISEIRAVELDRIGNLIVLRGVVGSFYYKQLAQELIRARASGFEIENQICVEYIAAEVTSETS